MPTESIIQERMMWNLRSQMILRLKELSENEVKCFVDIYSIHPFFFYSKFSTPLTIFHFLTDSSQIKQCQQNHYIIISRKKMFRNPRSENKWLYSSICNLRIQRKKKLLEDEHKMQLFWPSRLTQPAADVAIKCAFWFNLRIKSSFLKADI